MRRRHAASSAPWSALVLGILMLVTLAATGCGGGASAGGKTINAAQFNLLQEARAEIGTMIQETSEALNPSLTLAQQREKVTAVLEKHKGKMPDPQSFPMQPNAQRATAPLKLQQTLEGRLNALISAQLDSSAAFVAQMYQGSLDDLYGLQSFQDFLAKHTVAEGTRINPSDPPQQMQPSEQQRFPGTLSANITYDPATGDIKYILGEHEPDYMLSNSTPAQIQNQFVVDAKSWLTQGDDDLLDDADI